MRARTRGLVEPHVLVATRATARRQVGGSVVGFQGSDMAVRFRWVTMVRQSVRQRRGRAGGPEGEAQGGSD